MLRFSVLILFIASVVGGGMYYRHHVEARADQHRFRTEKIERGDLNITVDATGTIEPEEVVDVGAQVTGRIAELAKDPRGETDPAFADKSIDYRSPVKKGMLLAQIDKSVYAAQYDQANAALAQAQAHVLQTKAMMAQANAEWERAQKLKELKIPSRSPTGDASLGGGLAIVGISDSDYVLAEANAEGTKADVAAADATVQQQEANLKLAKTNLDYTTINSPIDGTIIDRRVNIGQTVVSNLNASSLFLIARDLRRMQVWASVNEADIARLQPGTKVHFSVDAFPDDTFYGTVFQVRLNAIMTQNVVTYTVVITVDNSDLRLLPYLTANVHFQVDERKDVLLVSNTALRYHPNPDLIESDDEDNSDDAVNAVTDKSDKAAKSDEVSKEGTASTKHRGEHAGHHGHGKADEDKGQLWVEDPDSHKLRAIDIEIGASDGTSTEIAGGDIKEGEEVVSGEQQATAATGDVNPFAPTFRRGSRRQSSQTKNSSK
ncbi:MAG TPA: efflux RND transporter periplasmic adaptor subunit [Lacipirellulaceae bacterium]|nr:efflux RND transporter periplasmic adaptor subunit [Lacipirellulaceae bacterium]